MNTHQTTSDSLHPPVIAGASTGGESRGFFALMKTPAQYETEIAALTAMNTKIKDQLIKALEALAAMALTRGAQP